MAELYITIPSIDDGEYIDLDNYESGEEILIYAKNKARKWAKMNGISYEDPIFTDANDIPDSLYEEDMDEAALDRLLEAYKASEEKGIPFEVVADIIREYDPSDLEDWIDEKYEGQFSSDTELGEHWIDGVYGGVDKLDKDTLERYFDYASYGSDLAYDYNVYDGYYFRSYKKGGIVVKPKAKKKKETTREAFEKLVKKVAEYYVGKPVKKEYQDKYGKTYDEKEAKQVGYAVATKVLGRPKNLAHGGEIHNIEIYDRANQSEPIYSTNDLMLAKIWVLKNWKRYDEIEIMDSGGDSIVVTKKDKLFDVKWLFDDTNKYANGGLFNDDSEEAYQLGKGVYWHNPFNTYEMNGVFYIYYKDIDDIQYITSAKDIKEAKWMVNALEFGYAMGRDELKKATMVYDNDTYYIKIGIFREKLGKNKMVADKKFELFERGASFKKPKISLSKGGNTNTTYEMTDDTYVNIFLSRDLKEKRSYGGLRFFHHRPSGVFITYDPKGYQTRVIITKDKSGESSIYEGDSIRDVKNALDKYGLIQVKEGVESNINKYADGGEIKIIPYYRTAFGGSMKEMTALLTQNLEEAKDYINNAIGDKDRFYIMVLEPICGAKLYKVVENITKR